MTLNRRRIPLAVAAVASLVAAACTNSADRPNVLANAKAPSSDVVAQAASYDLVAGRSGRFIVGLLSADKARLVAFGTVELSFAYLGDRRSTRTAAKPGAPVTARFPAHPGPAPRLI